MLLNFDFLLLICLMSILLLGQPEEPIKVEENFFLQNRQNLFLIGRSLLYSNISWNVPKLNFICLDDIIPMVFEHGV